MSILDHTANEQENGKSKLSLEKLPITILDQIFEFVQSPDLAKVAHVSRNLYWPAVARIYKNITIYLKLLRNGDGLSSYDFSDNKEWQKNYGTVVTPYRLEKLIEALKKKKSLAKLIRNVNIQCETASDPINNFVKLLPDLKSFHDVYRCFEGNIQGNLESVTCVLVPKLNFSSHLVELKLGALHEERYSFQKVARDIIALKSYKNLRKLQFVDCDYTEYPACRIDQHGPTAALPYWTLFIQEFVTQGVKLNLNALGLCGDFRKEKRRAISQLRKVIRLENLTSLLLYVFDSYDLTGGQETFTEMITKYTSSIESLELYAMDKENGTFFNAINNSLRHNIPNQLKELAILYHPQRDTRQYGERCIQDVILSSQQRLVKLKIDDGSWFRPDPRDFESFKEYELASSLMKCPSALEMERRKLFPRILDTPHSLPHMIQEEKYSFHNAIEQVHEILQQDKIYTSALKKMPLLDRYQVRRVLIDVKARGLIINGETLPFSGCSGVDSDKDGREDSRELGNEESENHFNDVPDVESDQ